MPIRPPTAVAAVTTALALATACAVAHEEEDGKTTRVAISTPVGAVAVRAGDNAGDTRLPLYPGAQVSRSGSDGHSERANVAIGTPWFGLRVVAAEYESGDAPERVLDFYRDQLRPLGPVTECRGDLDFKDGRPRCRADADAKDVQLVVGSEQRHRMVSVQPRGSGTSFALVSIQMGS